MLSMLDKLMQYQAVLMNQSQKQKEALQAIQQKYIQQFKKQLQNSLQNHWKRYRKVRKNLEKQVAAVQYYVKLGQQQRQNPDLEKKSQEWRSLLENTNLYALFKDIDDQIAWNFGVLEDFTFFCSFPLKQENHYEQTLTQIQILKNQQKQYSQLISTILTKYPPQKNVSPLHEAYTAIQQKYKTLLQLTCPSSSSSTNSQLKLKDNFPFIISNLISNKYLSQIDISIICETGIMKQEQYRELGDALLRHRFYLKSLVVRVMDMEFCQEKCDVVRRSVRKFKNLEKFVIFNYYQECKLGMFVDFNWAPYRKNINVKASVWK